MTILEGNLYFYQVVGLAKSLLVVAEVHVAAYTAHRVNGQTVWLLMLGFVVGVLLTALLIWPSALKKEGRRFFLTNSRFSVMRQLLSGYCDFKKQSTEKKFI